MKKSVPRGAAAIKKIALRCETIAQLTHTQLARVGAGYEPTSEYLSCRADLCTTTC